MELAEVLGKLKKTPSLLDGPEGKKHLMSLLELMVERIEVLEELAGERQLDAEDLYSRLENLDDELRELSEATGYEFGGLTSDELDDGALEMECPECGSMMLVYMTDEKEEVSCPECGAEFTLELERTFEEDGEACGEQSR